MTNTQRQALTRLLAEVEAVRPLLPPVESSLLDEAAVNVRMAFKLFEVRPSDEVQLTLFELPEGGE